MFTIPAATIAAFAMPAFAQEATDPLSPGAVEQKEMADDIGLTAEQQAQYDAWPAEVQAYHDSLSPERQEMFWRLSEEDKVTLAGLSDAESEQVWASLMAQSATTG